MTFHIDVFYKQQGNDREVVYMTAIMQIDEELSEKLLGLVDAVLGEFRKENPYITNMYIESENAGSYHKNFATFKVYKICKSKGAKLKHYDFKSPIHFTTKYYFIILLQVNNH